MDPLSLSARLADVEVIDVRFPNEWEAGHIDGARHIPMDALAERFGEVDRERPVVAVCRSGGRSEHAVRWLQSQGVDAHNLDGGMLEWEQAGLPFAAADGTAGTVVLPEPPAP